MRLAVEALESREMLTTIQIFAAGSQGVETMDLRIDGATVESWTVAGGESSGAFQEYVYETSDTISADRVRVAMRDSQWDPANGIDHNLRVDAIVVDGRRLETEDASVFSTGTWKPSDGIVPGFRQSEYMHIDGYFQYSENHAGDLIRVRARGDEGVERFNLLISDTAVETFTVSDSDQVFQYTAAGTVSADDIRIQFLNDLWDPANSIDHNLIVDYVEVDGERYETESPNVFSTGTWKPSDGIAPGFRQSETLHTNGYFQYAADPVDGGDIRLVSSVYSISESGSSIDIQVIRENGSDGAVSVEYDTIDSTALAGTDYQALSGLIAWADGESGIKTISVPILEDTSIEGDERFSLTIDNVVGEATLLAPRTATITIDDNDSVQSQGDGLLGEYYDTREFADRFLFRTDSTINFDWGSGAPAAGMGTDTFSVRWTGQIEPLYSETYAFQTTTDDGVRLWVDGQLIIDQFVNQAATSHTGTIALEAGVLYDIRMDYYENLGRAVSQLRWSSASQPLQVVPQSQLYAAEDPPPEPGDELVAQDLVTGLPSPTSLDWTPDGETMYVSLKRGEVRVVQNGVLEATPFIDISDIVNGTRDRGLLDIAVHPNFENTPYVYLLFTYDPPEVFQNSGLAGPDGSGNRAGRLMRVTADAANDYKTAIAGSEVVILGTNSTWDNFNGFVNSTNDFDEPPAGINPDGTNVRDFVASDSESHTIGGVEFGIDGNLFVSIGDGTSYNAMDPRTIRVQDIDNLSGKVLRIDPITGEGLSDNPFFNGDPSANRSKVYQLGLRNPFRITVDDNTGQLFIGDVGWTNWEELNSGPPGANFGWPYYEGGNGVNLQTNRYRDLPEAQIFYASGEEVTPAIYALNHSDSGINAIILGDVYTGDAYPSSYQGDLFFNDLGQGIVRNISFDAEGNIANVETFSTGAQIVVHIQQGPDGNMYYIDLNDNKVGRWVFL
ncbi:MAG: PQQ-dependent sugar dehydrogenase [Planctomycetota bacterium]